MTATTSRLKIVVVGGGITGAFAAYFLAVAGCEVVLVERAGIGNQASGLNPGGINPLHGTGIPGAMAALAMESFQLHRSLWETLNQQSGIDFSPKQAPRIHVALDDGDLAELERLHARHTQSAVAGFSARWLDRSELRSLDARLNPAAIRGLWTEGNAKVDAHALTCAVASAAEKSGATIQPGVVVGIRGANGTAHAVELDQGTIPCDGIVFATGAWVSELSRWIGCQIPLQPIKGELLYVRTAGSPISHSFAWQATSIYGVGREEVWLGGNEEHAGFDNRLTSAARDFIMANVTRLMPGMQVQASLKQTAAFRPTTSDDIPIIGLAPGWKNVGLALGGGRKGMLYGAAMGRAVAELVTVGETNLSIAACSPTRF